MKRNLLTVMAGLLITSITLGQSTRFGIVAGSSIANYKMKSGDISVSADSKVGFTAGIITDIPIGNNCSFQPALHFVQKGTKSEESFGGLTEKNTLTVNCVELPLNVLYNVSAGSGKFFIGAGPSFGFNISGKTKFEDGTISETEDLRIGNDADNDDIRSFDMGINSLAGYRFSNGLFVSAGYNAGLNNLAPGADSEDGTVKSHYFSIKIGFVFGK